MSVSLSFALHSKSYFQWKWNIHLSYPSLHRIGCASVCVCIWVVFSTCSTTSDGIGKSNIGTFKNFNSNQKSRVTHTKHHKNGRIFSIGTMKRDHQKTKPILASWQCASFFSYENAFNTMKIVGQTHKNITKNLWL